MSLKLTFIGAGNINKNHMRSAKELGLEMVGVYDIVQSSADAIAKEFGVGKAYTDLAQMLAEKSVDAVVVGTPNKFHAEHSIAALNAGKHVLLEKPMAMSSAECDAIIVAMKKSGKILQMGMVNRFKNSVGTLKHFIDAGKCGNLYTGQAFWYRRRGIPGFGGWFTTKSMSGGGALIDIGVHVLDLALYLMKFPKPVAVSGMTYNVWKELDQYTYTSMWGKPTAGGKKDVDDYALAIVRFADGQTLQVNVSWALNYDLSSSSEMGLRLAGDKGGVELKGMDAPHIYAEEAGHLVDVKPYFTTNNAFVDEMKHFAECIENNTQPIASAEQGRTVQSILDAIYRSGEERREIRLD